MGAIYRSKSDPSKIRGGRMKVAITGGSGALGRQLIADWFAAGVEKIRVVSRDEHKHRQ